jgi:hypothetical protein
MRTILAVAVLAVSVGAAVWFNQSSTEPVAATPAGQGRLAEAPDRVMPVPTAAPDTRDILQEKADQRVAVMPALVSDQQRLQVVQQEAELLSMAEQYDAVRSYPIQREQHRAAMKEKLAQYSEHAAPVILEQVRRQQSVE